MPQVMDCETNEPMEAAGAAFNQPEKLLPILQIDIAEKIFTYVSFTDRVRFERVCSTWKKIIQSSHLKQHAIGNAPVKYSQLERCHQKDHTVTKLDLVKKKHLTNPAILTKIVLKCPQLKAIHISDINEPCHLEYTPQEEPPPLTYDPSLMARFRIKAKYIQRHIDGCSLIDLTDPHFLARTPCQPSKLARLSKGSFLDLEGKIAQIPLEALVNALTQCKLECLDISGMPFDESDLLKFLRKFCLSTNVLSLRHIKCRLLGERSLKHILTNSPICEISAIRPATGLSLNFAPPTLTKLAIKSLDERGLDILPSKDALTQLFLCNTTPESIRLISDRYTNLTSLNLSFADKLAYPARLTTLRRLKKLQHFYLKFQYPFVDLDHKLNISLKELFDSLTSLKSIRLANCPIQDDTFRTIALSNRELKLLDYRMPPNHMVGGLVLIYLSALPSLHTCYISCINTFSENSLIQMLIESRCLRKLKIHGCTELIPQKEIYFAALQRAGKIPAKSKLSIDIQIEEQMAIHIGKTSSSASNLKFTIRSLNDYFTTRTNFSVQNVPVGQLLAGDFDAEIIHQ